MERPDGLAPAAGDSREPLPSASTRTTRRKLPKVQNLQSDDDREMEDLTVGKFYLDSGNLEAAYLRSQDAVKLAPSDPDAHFLLARVAEKLKKNEQAAAEFSALLKLDASSEQIKTAKKALAKLQ